jgi:hypothetical protein
MKNGGSRATGRGPAGEHGTTMNPLLRSVLLSALLLSTGYVIDIDCFRPQPTFGAPLQPPCARGNAARLWTLSGAPSHELSLVLDGVPAPGWRVPPPYE